MTQQVKGVQYSQMASPLGSIWIASSDQGICTIGLGPEQPARFFGWLAKHFPSEQPSEAELTAAITELREYLSRLRLTFSLPIDLRGTPFQQAVWHQVRQVSYGTTATYSGIANRIGRPRAARAVGNAVGANPLPILVPCHRIVRKGRGLSGYSGGVEIKKALLSIERVLD